MLVYVCVTAEMVKVFFLNVSEERKQPSGEEASCPVAQGDQHLANALVSCSWLESLQSYLFFFSLHILTVIG